MNIVTLATILLALRILTVIFMAIVLKTQYPLLKAINDPQIMPLRYLLFIFAIIITIGNVVPIMIDLYGLFIESQSADTFDPKLTVYFLNNAISTALSSICFWLIYKFTGLNTDEKSKR